MADCIAELIIMCVVESCCPNKKKKQQQPSEEDKFDLNLGGEGEAAVEGQPAMERAEEDTSLTQSTGEDGKEIIPIVITAV
jgi:hypothetical protein